jgi:hypothetical protein
MKKMLVYVDASVVGGRDDIEFAEDSLALWRLFVQGQYVMVLSEHTLRELTGAPERVRKRRWRYRRSTVSFWGMTTKPMLWPKRIWNTGSSGPEAVRIACT